MSATVRFSRCSRLRFAVVGTALMFCTACPADRAMQVPPGQPAVVSAAPAESSQPAKPVAAARLRDDGGSCFSGSQCVSAICEGASCDGKTPGTCVPEDRACTADVVDYCGCDGSTFSASSSCPGESFAKKGRCDEATSATP